MKVKLIIFSLLLTSCHPIFCSWQNGYKELNYEPSEQEIVGQYELSEKSKSYLNENYYTWPLKIELSKNKEYKLLFENNPESLSDKIFIKNETKSGIKINQTGKWFLYFDKTEKICYFELEGICVEPLYEKDGKTSITITIGDGDECSGIVYEKLNK